MKITKEELLGIAPPRPMTSTSVPIRIAALEAASRYSGPATVDGVLHRAEQYEAWLLRGVTPS